MLRQSSNCISDFAGGTSSASSKLVHGGFRYLPMGDIGLVRESQHERRVLMESVAPNLVRPIPIVLPVYFQCTKRCLPIYTISRNEDVRGQIIDYERLMLPFFSDHVLSDIVISGKLISEAGRFELNNMFRVREKLPVLLMRTVIDRDLSPPNPREQSRRAAGAADVVEI